jgi:hypothetical protein
VLNRHQYHVSPLSADSPDPDASLSVVNRGHDTMAMEVMTKREESDRRRPLVFIGGVRTASIATTALVSRDVRGWKG